MSSRQPRLTSCVVLLALVSLPTWAQTRERGFDRSNRDQRQILIRTDNITVIAERYGLEVLDRHQSSDGPLWLVDAPRGLSAKLLAGALGQDPDVKSATGVSLATLPAINLSHVQAAEETTEDVSLEGDVWSPCLAWIDGDGVWRGYADQRAAQMTRLHFGHYLDEYWCGYGITVAVIDTAIDSQHPLLEEALVDGYNFLEDSSGLDATQISELDTKTRAIVEADHAQVVAGQGTLAVLDSAAIIMGEMSEEVLEDLGSKGDFYPHSTMVSGIIRLTAPAARIMPLTAFDEDGVGHPFDIVRAIDYAVDNGAHVINMSFSITDASQDLLDAVERARQRGVMTVAAAGNNGEASYIYPAAYGATIGVAATDFDDQLTDFSNYGLVTADIAAPGAGIVTTYPGGLFATGWGTSFSTPMVSGNVALVRTYHPHLNSNAHRKTRLEVLLGSNFYSYLWDYILSSGRLDTVGAVMEARR